MGRFCLILGLTLALLVAVPQTAEAGCGMGNPCPVVDSLTVSPQPVPAASTAILTCSASDNGVVAKVVFRASQGSFPGGVTEVIIVTATPTVVQSIAWTAPSNPGSQVTLSCTPWDNGGFMGISTAGAAFSVVVDVVAASLSPWTRLPRYRRLYCRAVPPVFRFAPWAHRAFCCNTCGAPRQEL